MTDPHPEIQEEIGSYNVQLLNDLATPVIDESDLASSKSKFSSTWSLLVFIYNCSGNSAFTMHMTLSRVGLFWAVAITAFVIACICYSLNMLETVARNLEKEHHNMIQIRNSTDMSKRLKSRGMSVTNFIFTFGAVCSVQADALTDLTLVATNLKLISDIDTFFTKLGLLVIISLLILGVNDPTEHKGGLLGSSMIYGLLGNLTMNQC